MTAHPRYCPGSVTIPREPDRVKSELVNALALGKVEDPDLQRRAAYTIRGLRRLIGELKADNAALAETVRRQALVIAQFSELVAKGRAAP